MARSTATRIVEVTQTKGQGELPPFLDLFLRHFQKAKPAVVSEKEATLTAPLDLLAMIVPTPQLNALDSIEIEFKKD